MKHTRREFLAKSTLGASTLFLNNFAFAKNVSRNSKMQLSFRPYTLELKHTFTIATMSRKTTPVMLTEIAFDEFIGYGEASMPPYLGESHESATKFLSQVDLSQFENPFELEKILNYVDLISPGNCAAKASIDIALHDLVGKIFNLPWYKIWGLEKNKTPNTTFTIGIDTPEVVREKMKDAADFKIIKVKLGKENDKSMIEVIRQITDKPITADANQGWSEKEKALEMINWLAERNVVFVEQPLPKTMIDENAWITERSPIPIIGDEGVQRLKDIPKAKGVYSGINIKLMKCTGMREARKMIDLARAFDMKIMLGCMTETSCAISAASHLSPLVDWADLDGALLIKNDLFDGTKIENGKIILQNKPGIGIIPKR